MKFIKYISIILWLALTSLSCNRIKTKSEEITLKVKEKTSIEVRKQTQKVIDKLAPTFNAHQPDTEHNKKRFIDFIKVEITPDVKNIYCHADALGIDADYMFSFNCSINTSNKIIAKHSLTIDNLNTDNAFALQHNFNWWDKETIQKLQKYSWTNGNQYFKYYWYDYE
ncbi:hypothetical protein [Neptunitalea lumnitzerae]|uniref:Lipoprotein n=1 Tax=Neptunitalea lumnitzerae TaxID=2965509 RepID=A0ABQ5MIY8_9FLAO|nr:hypothetical protein [Neptunitalea sp. Y10]GLB49381.1 hypothetical protein Y10_17490 [Neptunitalea sp. Y10]